MQPVISDYINSALDIAYSKTAGGLLNRIDTLANGYNSDLQRDLRALDKEAESLSKEERALQADNAQLEKVYITLGTVFAAAVALIIANSGSIENAAQAIALPSVTARVHLKLANKMVSQGINPISITAMNFYRRQLQGTDWNAPEDILSIAARFMETEAFGIRMEEWAPGYVDLIRQSILSDIQRGYGPKAIATNLRKLAQGMPRSAAENFTRTLLITSYREASLAMESINGGFIIEKVRIAKLDTKTCLACVALHGTVLQRGQRVDDHYRGRCSEFYRVPGGDLFPATMQADSTPGHRRFVKWMSGEEWFNSLSPERQKQQSTFTANPAAFKAFQDGVPLSAFVGEREDSIFGQQVVQKSLIGAIGKTMAEKYYTKRGM